jgi:methylglutaconyl-CoA hydratase
MENLKTRLDDRGIYYLNINRPNVMNAFDENLIEELDNVLSNISNNKNIRAMVLTGEGKAFSAGGDLDWMKRMANLSHDENHKDAMKLAVMLNKLDTLPFPTIAAVNGAAFGGGVGLVSACDIAIGNENAKFSLSEVRLGLIPATISPYVVRAVGSRNARYLFMTSSLILPEEAHHIGLLTHYTSNNNFSSLLEKNIKNILKGGPEAIKASKDLIFYVEDKNIDESVMTETAKRIADARATDEGKEGTNAFLNKMKPSWQINDK